MKKVTKDSIVHKVHSLQEIQKILKNVPAVVPIAGTTGFAKGQTEEILYLPEHILDLNNLDELKNITKTERYIEFGALVTLNEILSLGNKNIPAALYQSIEKVGNNGVRALATIGGNIAEANPEHCLFLPMLALDAKIEIITDTETVWVPFAKYIDDSFTENRNNKFVITRIRIPNKSWSNSFYMRLGDEGLISEDSASFLFLTQLHKNILLDMRLLFAAFTLVREKEFDNLLLGHPLPLLNRDIIEIYNQAKKIFTRDKFDLDYHFVCFFNLLEDNLYRLS